MEITSITSYNQSRYKNINTKQKISFRAISPEGLAKIENATTNIFREEINNGTKLAIEDGKTISDTIMNVLKKLLSESKLNVLKESIHVNGYKPNNDLDFLLDIKNTKFTKIEKAVNEKGEETITFTKQYTDDKGITKDYVAIVKNGQNATVYKPNGSIDYEVTYKEKTVESSQSKRLNRLWQEWFATKPGELSMMDILTGKTNSVGYLKVVSMTDGSKSITKRMGDDIVKFKLDANGKETEYAEYIFIRRGHFEQLKMNREYNHSNNSFRDVYYNENREVTSFKETRMINNQEEIRWFDKDSYRINENGEPYIYSSKEEMQNEWYPVMSLETISQNLSGRTKAQLTDKEAEYLAKTLGLEDSSILNHLNENREIYRTLALKYHPDRNPDGSVIMQILSKLKEFKG